MAALEARGLDPATLEPPSRVSAEMAAWMDAHVPAVGPPEERLQALLRAFGDPQGLDLRYQDGFTGTAQEVFRSRRFNCLSFSHLFVGMARRLGLDAYYMRVDDIQGFDKEGDLVVVAGHVTAGFGPPSQRQILEFGVGPRWNYRSARPISDLQALALHHSNRGAELLLAGDSAGAVERLEIAVRIDPTLPAAWVNLGVARRRSGDLVGAEAAYHTAIDLEPENLSAFKNLAALLRLQGDRRAAQKLLRLLAASGTRNPFTYLVLGDASLSGGRLEEARRFYRRAHRLARREAEIAAALGEVARRQGRLARARRWGERAFRLDPREPRGVALRDALAASDRLE